MSAHPRHLLADVLASQCPMVHVRLERLPVQALYRQHQLSGLAAVAVARVHTGRWRADSLWRLRDAADSQVPSARGGAPHLRARLYWRARPDRAAVLLPQR
eukprot:6202647-Pleurochrysis_carterae.AAC.2